MVDIKHTPTPWRVDNLGDICIIGGDEEIVCIEDDYYPVAPTEENMKHIVKCVNMHDELVEALELLIDALDNEESEVYFKALAREALKKAGAL